MFIWVWKLALFQKRIIFWPGLQFIETYPATFVVVWLDEMVVGKIITLWLLMNLWIALFVLKILFLVVRRLSPGFAVSICVDVLNNFFRFLLLFVSTWVISLQTSNNNSNNNNNNNDNSRSNSGMRSQTEIDQINSVYELFSHNMQQHFNIGIEIKLFSESPNHHVQSTFIVTIVIITLLHKFVRWGNHRCKMHFELSLTLRTWIQRDMSLGIAQQIPLNWEVWT